MLVSHSSVKSYSILGDQIVKSTSSIQSKSNPGIGTAVTEHLLGSSFATLKGLKNISIENNQEIVDSRTTQIILKDNTDIEISGHDFIKYLNRIFGSSDSLSNTTKLLENREKNESNYAKIVNVIKEYKSLLDEGIITQEEFSEMKKKIIDNI
jgi:hypothetical protein